MGQGEAKRRRSSFAVEGLRARTTPGDLVVLSIPRNCWWLAVLVSGQLQFCAQSRVSFFRLFETERHIDSRDRALHRLQAAFRAGIFNSVEVACSREGLRVVFAIQGEMSDAAEEAKRNEKARSLGHQLEIGPTGEVPPSSTNGAKKTP